MTNCTVIIVLLNVNAVEEDLMYTVEKKRKKEEDMFYYVIKGSC